MKHLCLFLFLIAAFAGVSQTWYPFENERGQRGWMEPGGKIMLPPSSIRKVDFPLVYTGQHIGLADSSGHLVADTVFTRLYEVNDWNSQRHQPTKDRVFVFSRSGDASAKVGLMDATGKLLLPADYSDIKELAGNLLVVTKDRQIRLMTAEGYLAEAGCPETRLYNRATRQLLPYEVYSPERINAQLVAATVVSPVKSGTGVLSGTAFLDLSGKIIRSTGGVGKVKQAPMDWASSLQVVYSGNKGYYVLRDRFIDSFTVQLRSAPGAYWYQRIADHFHYDSLQRTYPDFVVVNDSLQIFLSRDGNTYLDTLFATSDYRLFRDPHHSVYKVVGKTGKWGLMDLEFQWLLRAEYDSIPVYHPGWVQADKNGVPRYFLQPAKGELTEIRIPDGTAFASVLSRSSPMKIVIRSGGKFGIATENGEILLAVRYDEIRREGADFTAVTEQGQTALLDADLRVVFPARFERLRLTGDEQYIIVENGLKSGLFTVDGKKILPVKLDRIYEQHGFFVVRENKRVGLVDRSGRTVLPSVYKQIDFVGGNDTLFRVERDSTFSYYNIRRKKMIGKDLPKVIHFGPYTTEPERDQWFSEGIVEVETQEGFGLLREDGTFLKIPSRGSSESLYATRMESGLLQVTDSNRKQLVKGEFEQVTFINEHAALLLTRNAAQSFFLDVATLQLHPTDCIEVFIYQTELMKKGFFLGRSGNSAISLYDSTFRKLSPGDFDYTFSERKYDSDYPGQLSLTFTKGDSLYIFDLHTRDFTLKADRKKTLLCADGTIFIDGLEVIEDGRKTQQHFIKARKGDDILWIAILPEDPCGFRVYYRCAVAGQ